MDSIPTVCDVIAAADNLGEQGVQWIAERADSDGERIATVLLLGFFEKLAIAVARQRFGCPKPYPPARVATGYAVPVGTRAVVPVAPQPYWKVRPII